MTAIQLEVIKRTEPDILRTMAAHYSRPKGFVGRNICYRVWYDDVLYGHIVGGSATRFLPGRDEFLDAPLNNIVNNIFYHVAAKEKYPLRNFTSKVVEAFEKKISEDWELKYNDAVWGFEALVELPRIGELYRKIGYTRVGITKGFTCKRTRGQGTDSWSGQRFWIPEEIHPKLVLCKKSPSHLNSVRVRPTLTNLGL